MKITMLTTVPGSIDGIRVAQYEAGIEYDLATTDGARELAAAFVDAGFAHESGEAGARPDDSAPGEQIDGQGLDPVRAKPGPKPKK
jgi:hypothetical protein